MTNQTIEQAVEEFGNQFDELNMKPPKNSMPGLERELLKDFMRKTLQAQRDAGAEEERENWKSVLDADSCECDNCHRTRRYLKNPAKELHKVKQALTPPTK